MAVLKAVRWAKQAQDEHLANRKPKPKSIASQTDLYNKLKAVLAQTQKDVEVCDPFIIFLDINSNL